MRQTDPDLGHLVNHVARLFRQALGREAATFGLTAQQAAVVLSVADQAVSLGTVAEQLGIDRPTMTGVAERLVRDGWSDLQANPADGRSRLLSPTRHALDVLPQLASSARRIGDAATHALTPDEARQLESLLGAVARALEPTRSR